MIESINPATGQKIADHPLHSAAYVDAALDQAVAAQKEWAATPIETRCALLKRIAQVLRDNRARYARTITLEMGKPIAEAEGEIEKCAWTCDHYAQSAASYLADQIIASNASESRVAFEPLGVVMAIMPWNYPFWQFIRFAAPALAAGNGAILRHASNVPQCALDLQEVFDRADTPKGLMRTLFITHDTVAQLIADDRISGVTLTGSTEAGKKIAALAGAAMKKQVLELGGSDPFIVLADADIPLAAKTAVKARFSNNGQSCISSKRFIVDASVADRFVELLCKEVAALKLGDPLTPGTTLGPMARDDLRTELHDQVSRTLAAGAQLKLGGHFVDGPGYFYAPTILDHVTANMPAACEETFGPVATIIRVNNTEEALRLANDTPFGLGAAVWSNDLPAAKRLAHKLHAGAVFINGLVASDARLPFGGVKQSGYGRELGEVGIREFTNIKTIWIGPAK